MAASLAKKKVQVFKSHLDDRYGGVLRISSHDGQQLDATPVNLSVQVAEHVRPDTHVVAIDEAQFLDDYRRRTGRADIPDWTFFIVFSLFRSAGILAGVYRRSVDGQGVDARMAQAKAAYQDIAARAWEIARDAS